LLLSLSGLQIFLERDRIVFAVGMGLGGSAIAFLTGAWFNSQLGGHTGDTYGAVVEWTEALLLCLLTAL
jgi:adenosylcobinamide-GDP ribazoletransferase